MPFKAMVMLMVCLAQGLCQRAYDPAFIATQHRIAVDLASQGKLGEAMTILQRNYASALEAADNLRAAQAAGYLGTLHRFQGDAARAIPLLRFAKSRFPPGSEDAALVSAQLGMAFAQDGNLALAEQELRSAGAHPSVQAHLGAVLIRRGALAEAETILREILRKPDSPEPAAKAVRAFTHLSLARLFATTGQRKPASFHFQSALDIYDTLSLQSHPDRAEAVHEYERFRKRGRSGGKAFQR